MIADKLSSPLSATRPEPGLYRSSVDVWRSARGPVFGIDYRLALAVPVGREKQVKSLLEHFSTVVVNLLGGNDTPPDLSRGGDPVMCICGRDFSTRRSFQAHKARQAQLGTMPHEEMPRG